MDNAARASLRKAWLLLGVGAVTSIPVLVLAVRAVQARAGYGRLLGIVWPAACVAFAIWLLRLSRTGVLAKLTLRLPEVPILLGRQTIVELEAVAAGFGRAPVLVTVRCAAVDASDDDRERILWEDSWEVASLAAGQEGERLVVQMPLTLPKGCPPTGREGRVHVVWQLFVRVQALDGERIGSFELPVFAGRPREPVRG